jgi:hypothetical protein
VAVHNVDKTIRSRVFRATRRAIYLLINLAAKVRGSSGGFAGTAIGCAGKFLVSFVGHGTLLAVSYLTGPAQRATFLALESLLAPTIEHASMVAAIAGGIALGAATGPV